MRKAIYIIISILFVWPCVTQAALCTPTDYTDSIVPKLLEHCNRAKESTKEQFGNLYIKQRVGVFKNNLLLNTFPGMPRFDKETKNHLTELFYQFHYTDYGIMELRRKSHNTTFKHGSGEIEHITEFIKGAPLIPHRLRDIFFPLDKECSRYYTYTVDSTTINNGKIQRRISFKSKFDNIRLLEEGWVWTDDSCNISELYIKGWDEQSRYEAIYTMGAEHGERNVVKNVHIDMDYNFAGNKLSIVADAIFDYDYALSSKKATSNNDKYNLTGETNVAWDTTIVGNRKEYALKNRKLELDGDEKAMLGDSSTSIGRELPATVSKNKMWEIGDKIISSHTYYWNSGRVKFSPLIDPSHIDYSSSRGLSYKLSMNLTNNLSRNREIRFKPQVGYNFKQKALYWNIDGKWLYYPSKLGEIGISIGEGTHTYSSAVLNKIKEMKLDSLDFNKLNLKYFRNLYLEASHKCEISNGLTLLTGLNFHRRELEHGSDKTLESYGVKLKRCYSQFAPHLRLTWQPGMYYYMDGRRKVNIGSKHPTISLDVEQGVNGILGSNSIYTRSELDVQYKLPLRPTVNLYMRFGTGGYFYTKDVYFVDYAFLKSNNLPLERSEELGGVFQLLDSEWYNAANKYMRANFTYETAYHSLQKLFPRIKLLKNEYIYYNILFLSKLCPYMELGYGVATPYVDMGLFVSSQNGKMHRIGYKISFSLFSD